MNVSKLADINIPQGRGMIKWAPFATMPEQYENVDRLMEEQSHVPEPTLNIDLLQELELKLRELQGENVVLRYWDSGYEFQQECVIEHIDDWSRTVTAIKDGHVIIVQFEHIYGVDKYGYFDEVDCHT